MLTDCTPVDFGRVLEKVVVSNGLILHFEL
jgi:hypothetical protein